MALFDRFRKKAKTVPTETSEGSSAANPAEEHKARVAAKLKPEETVNAAKASLGSELSFRLIKRPHISEKAVASAAKGTYVFEVPIAAEKIAIKKAVEALYRVKVRAVRTSHVPGKAINRGRRPGRRAETKKALVTLHKGQSLDLYGGV